LRIVGRSVVRVLRVAAMAVGLVLAWVVLRGGV
jgi:hypothetical protein